MSVMKIGAIILAAGAASRFGRPKQLLELGGEILVDRACRLATEAGCSPVVRVLGANADQIQQGSNDDRVVTVVNEKWADGMGGSLARGMEALLAAAPDADGVIILLCDQPAVNPSILDTLVASLRRASIVLSDCGESTGPPAAFGRVHFPELLALSGDRGAKAIATAHPESVATIAFPEGRWDIDSEAEWVKFLGSNIPPV